MPTSPFTNGGDWAEAARGLEQQRIAQAAYDSLTAVGVFMRDIMRQMRKQNNGGRVKTKRAKATRRPSRKQDIVHDQATLGKGGQGFSDRPTKEEVLEWAAMQKKLYKDGKLPDAFVKALEAVPGWTWDAD